MCMKYMFLMLVVCLLFSACSRDIVVINSVVTAEIEGQISNETGNTVETGEREPCMTLSIEPKNVVRDGDTTELMLTVSCDSPNTILYGAKSYPIYYWDEQSRTWISDLHIAVPSGQQGRNSRPCRDIMGGHPQNAKFVRKQP